MNRYKYIQLPFDIIPQEIINEYNLTNISHNVKVNIAIWKVMYGLSQSERIEHERFKNHLEKHRYQPIEFTPGIWNHKSSPISFTIIVDDFGIKCVGKKHTNNIIEAMQ